ncbi:hypothetical protein FOA43_004278 [Brettanomyces nanus]|uniref:Cytoplasmic tRNA 2-thiolation protein 2 n=1 Tax=Eeniella nana TaxID=13502 RepID=A0A875SDY0_EENNA|nr:uncharacterized protein FOA43_004278 [Brettanomyces nanus]QPG76884.1 hypothetical protein FOA43_004278 [Brettanomyces nanus]
MGSDDICRRCHERETVVVSRKEHFCEKCFLRFIRSKQRKQMKDEKFKVKYGKDEDRIKEETPKIMIPLRFTTSSLVLLDILLNWLDEQLSMSPRAHIGFDLVVLAMNSFQSLSWTTEKVSQLEEKYGGAKEMQRLHVSMEIVDLDEMVRKNTQIREVYLRNYTSFCAKGLQKVGSLHEMVGQITDKSLQEDFLLVLEEDVIVKRCIANRCSCLVFSDSMSELAVSVLGLTARGRGEKISEKLGGDMVKETSIESLYPLRDVLGTEVKRYAELCDLTSFVVPRESKGKSVKNKTINELVEEYFESVEPEYPEVVSTVVKAGSKLTRKTCVSDPLRCSLCDGIIPEDPGEWLENRTVTDGIPAETDEERANYQKYILSVTEKPSTEAEMYKMPSGESDIILEKALIELQKVEKEQQEIDKKVQKYRVQLTKPLFAERRKAIRQIPKFWYIVLAQHEDFQEYIQTEDMKYLEFIKDLYVEKMADEKGPNEDPKTFALTFTFESPNKEIDSQTVTKYFYTEVNPDTGYESIKSHDAKIEWPKEFDDINPNLIKKSRKDHKWTHEKKKNYRVGMKSFFAFFSWTGLKDNKEFRYGEQLAEMFSEDIFPLAVEYYTLAAPGIGKDGEDEESDSSSEELDIDSDEDDDEDYKKPASKKQKIHQ